MSGSPKKPWVKMPFDEAKELCLLRARLLEMAQKEKINFQDRPLTDILEEVISEMCEDSYNEGWLNVN